ncbi:MAG: IPT/TIG domain-containing protein [Elusimicrobiota bacterium]|nr:MAG: IPT/TIG domain-containing protein [Elusimicrobiota bacterium]
MARGGSAFNLTVDGANYVSGASVRFNGATRTGTLQGTTRLIVYIPASDVVAPATVTITVVNPGPGGGPSNARTFVVTGSSAPSGGANAVPSISALSPSSRPPGGGAFNLTVDGAGFASGASVRWNGLNRPGTLQGSSRLIVYIPPSDVAAAGTAEVRVFNPAPGGGLSNALTFTIGTSSAETVSPAADPSFSFREHYAFPSPSRRGQPVTIRVRAGLADSVEVRVYDLAGRLVKAGRPARRASSTTTTRRTSPGTSPAPAPASTSTPSSSRSRGTPTCARRAASG